MQVVQWPQRSLIVLLLIPTVIIGCGGSGEGRVLADGKTLGEFEASPNPFQFDATHARLVRDHEGRSLRAGTAQRLSGRVQRRDLCRDAGQVADRHDLNRARAGVSTLSS